MDINTVRLDLDASEEGVFFPIGDGFEVKIAKWNNKNHMKFLKEMAKKHGRLASTGAISDEQSERIVNDQWPTIVTDWKGLKDGKAEFKYSATAVIDLANNPQFSELFKKITAISQGEENYRAANIAEMGKL